MQRSNDEIKKQLMELLKNELPVLRAKGRLSQADTAEAIGVSRQTYSSIETGKRDMPWTTFLALIAFFQNNENTKQMLNDIDGLSEGMEHIIRQEA